MEILTHASTATSPEERGREIGSAFGAEIRGTVRRYLDFFRSRGLADDVVHAVAQRSLAALGDWSPGLAEELRATALAAGVEVWQLAALNARTEVLAIVDPDPESECSTWVFAPPPPARPETIQTWDWHDALCPAGLMLAYVPDAPVSGRRAVHRVRLFTELGVLGKIGVNDAGIGVHFNILHHASDHADGGVPVHAIARRILDEADSVEAAVEIARSARVSASTVVTVVSASEGSPRAACLEISPERVAVVLPDADHLLLHTNHFLDPVQTEGEATRDAGTTYERLAHVTARAAAMTGLGVRERAAEMCGPSGGSAPVCFTPDLSKPPHEQWTTLLTVSLDLVGIGLDYYPGSPDLLAEHGPRRF
ncbi:peptidase C45 [Leucobacter weissii]|uniref:Peptidase C45 n=1 Tax=Leucobacter weissii TaxID=1983706 RepID=A0A939MGL5_9MICO|nr:C45 family peptidase [Leucobacter weissii]MBO1900338.1 peptidase C45 [Leucobacter weissii]